MGKKNLDKMFQEKFSDFEEIPDEKVWDAISVSLDKKKSRKLIPFWWKLGGVAALLAILFVIVNPFEDKNDVAPILTDTENVEKENASDQEDGKIIPIEETSKEAIQVADTDAAKTNADSNSPENQEAVKTKTNLKEKQSDFIASKNNQVKASQLATSDSGETVQENKSNVRSGNKQTSENGIESNEVVAEINKRKSKENPKKEPEKSLLNEKLNIDNSIEEGVANATDEKKDEELVDESKKKSIFEEIEKQKDDKEVVVGSSKSKWSVGANLAPVYFNSFGEGSPIDPAFNANSKSGNFNMSYGLSVAYGVSKKLSIRTGIGKVDYGYNTNEVEFSASLQGSLSGRLNNINYSEAAENVVIESKSENGFAFAGNKSASDVLANDISRNGIVAQEFGYIEVPVELDYALIDNRFGVNLVGGVSTMFLTNNSVALNDSNESIKLGEANNLNNVNFSTNVGFGLNYKFTPKLRLNVEPIFKYQLNTFSDTSGNFNPFSIGVYSGLNFKF